MHADLNLKRESSQDDLTPDASTTSSPMCFPETVALHVSEAAPTSDPSAHHLFGQMPNQQDLTEDRVLSITISLAHYPITEDILQDIFKPYGVEQIIVFPRATTLRGSVYVPAEVKFKSGLAASRARSDWHRQYIYKGSCVLRVNQASPDFSHVLREKKRSQLEACLAQFKADLERSSTDLLVAMNETDSTASLKLMPALEHPCNTSVVAAPTTTPATTVSVSSTPTSAAAVIVSTVCAVPQQDNVSTSEVSISRSVLASVARDITVPSWSPVHLSATNVSSTPAASPMCDHVLQDPMVVSVQAAPTSCGVDITLAAPTGCSVLGPSLGNNSLASMFVPETLDIVDMAIAEQPDNSKEADDLVQYEDSTSVQHTTTHCEFPSSGAKQFFPWKFPKLATAKVCLPILPWDGKCMWLPSDKSYGQNNRCNLLGMNGGFMFTQSINSRDMPHDLHILFKEPNFHIIQFSLHQGQHGSYNMLKFERDTHHDPDCFLWAIGWLLVHSFCARSDFDRSGLGSWNYQRCFAAVQRKITWSAQPLFAKAVQPSLLQWRIIWPFCETSLQYEFQFCTNEDAPFSASQPLQWIIAWRICSLSVVSVDTSMGDCTGIYFMSKLTGADARLQNDMVAMKELNLSPSWILCSVVVAFSQNLHNSVRCNKTVNFTHVAASFSMVECCCVLSSVIVTHIASLLKLTPPIGSPIYMQVHVQELGIDGFLQERVSSCLSLSGTEKLPWTIAWSVNGGCSKTASYWVGHVAICQPSTRQIMKLPKDSKQDKGLFLVVRSNLVLHLHWDPGDLTRHRLEIKPKIIDIAQWARGGRISMALTYCCDCYFDGSTTCSTSAKFMLTKITTSTSFPTGSPSATTTTTSTSFKKLQVPWDPGGWAWFRLEGKPNFMEGGLSATWALPSSNNYPAQPKATREGQGLQILGGSYA